MSNITNKELFEKMPVPKAVQTMVVPTIIGQLIILIYNIADTFFIGRTSNPYMVAGASLVLPVFNISIAIASVSGVGASALISRLLGEGREDEAHRVSSFSIYSSLFGAALFSLLILCFMKPIMLLLGAGPETYEFSCSYALCVIVFGGIPTIMSNVFSNLVRSVGESRKAGIGVMMGGVINIFLDPVFMFILLPDGYEIIGAGIATCLSNCISCVYFIVVIRKLSKTSVLGLAPLHDLPEKSSVRRILAIGVPSALTNLLFDLDYIVIDRLMSGYNDIALAAVGIVLKAERLPLNIGVGICQGMVPIIAYNYASKNYPRMKKIAHYSLWLGIICALISIAMYEVFAPYIMRFFISDAKTVELGTQFLRIRSLATVLMFISFYHMHLFNGYNRGREALFLGIMRWAVFNIPMLFLLNSVIGMYGIVWSQFVADTMAVILSVYVHRKFLKNQHL